MWEKRLPSRVPHMGICWCRQRTERHGDGCRRVRGVPAGMWWIQTLYAYWAFTKSRNLSLGVMGKPLEDYLQENDVNSLKNKKQKQQTSHCVRMCNIGRDGSRETR